MPEEPLHAEDPVRRRQVRQRRAVLVVIALLIVAVVVVLVVILAGRDDGAGPDGNGRVDPGLTGVTSPYDFSELPAGSGPGEVKDATYVSLLLLDEAGALTSYGANVTLPAAKALLDAVRSADEVDAATLGTQVTAGGAGAAESSTITFIFADRSTLTYALYVERGLIARDGKVWEVEGELQELVQAVVQAGDPQTSTTQ